MNRPADHSIRMASTPLSDEVPTEIIMRPGFRRLMVGFGNDEATLVVSARWWRRLVFHALGSYRLPWEGN